MTYKQYINLQTNGQTIFHRTLRCWTIHGIHKIHKQLNTIKQTAVLCTLHGAYFELCPHETCTFEILLLKLNSRSFAVRNTTQSKLATLKPCRRSEAFYRKAVLKNTVKFTEKHRQSSYTFRNVAGLI